MKATACDFDYTFLEDGVGNDVIFFLVIFLVLRLLIIVLIIIEIKILNVSQTDGPFRLRKLIGMSELV